MITCIHSMLHVRTNSRIRSLPTPTGVDRGALIGLCSPLKIAIPKELSVSGSSLRNWVYQKQIDKGEREGLTTEEREELRKLRREIKVLSVSFEQSYLWSYHGIEVGFSKELDVASDSCYG